MILSPSEHSIFQQALPTTLSPSRESLALWKRLHEDELGPCVLRLRLELGPTVLAEMRRVNAERKRLRTDLGMKRLPKGVGPPVEMRPFAPTLNEYNGLVPWQKTRLREEIDALIQTALAESPHALMGMSERVRLPKARKNVKSTENIAAPKDKKAKPKKERVAKPQWTGGRRRAVVVTRYSSVEPDEIACDVIGFKVPGDRLVRAGVLRDDNREWLARYAEWVPVPAGTPGYVTIAIHELANP